MMVRAARLTALFLAAAVVGGCEAAPDRVLFITSTTYGVDVSRSPATIIIGRDRTEGYVAPRYPSGALPPVVATLETGGAGLQPYVRQVYATGAAAVRVTQPNADGGPQTMEGDGDGKMAFFGTSTTIGLKTSFVEAGPDVFTFGYKRQEFSWIPIATKNGTHIYPSVLGAIDTGVQTGTGPANTQLKSKQFFATGRAADELALNAAVRRAFETLAEDAAATTLTDEQRAAAIAAGAQQRGDHESKLNVVLAHAFPGGQRNDTRFQCLVRETRRLAPDPLAQGFEAVTDRERARSSLHNNEPAVDRMVQLIGARTCP